MAQKYGGIKNLSMQHCCLSINIMLPFFEQPLLITYKIMCVYRTIAGLHQ